ncbi:TraB/GumN family protein [Curvibacter sp. CHRR-16]|uniref:TraB/GumN family protein n=1 Tax=Curvibacter sp. CHRR-16 TaxID=2835872 RepID=UPI001BDA4B18|nr:TraB/GumN family protein [Curvibacter sp. CHRR-16]MBT0568734.1 TraB/GumN family protein [Curvibacter sp. CHRR-16]
MKISQKIRCCASALLVIVALNSHANSTNQEAISHYLQQNQLTPIQKGGLLYKAIKGDKSLYIFGANALAPVNKDEIPFTEKVLNAIGSSDYYASENGDYFTKGLNALDMIRLQKIFENKKDNDYLINFDEITQIQLISFSVFIKKELLPLLKDIYNSENEEKLKKNVLQHNAIYWLVLDLNAKCIVKYPPKIAKSTDSSLLEIGKYTNKKTTAILHPVDEIQKINSSLDEKNTIAALTEKLHMDLDKNYKIQVDCNEWIDGDEASIDVHSKSLTNHSNESLKKYYQLSIHNRNKTFFEKIQTISNSNDGTGFFSIPSIHLFGDLGILQLLKDNQYSIEKIQ